MKKLTLVLPLFVLLFSCNQSKKGAWNEEDKQRAQEEIAKIEGELTALGDKKDDFINCYLEKVEDNYDNFEAADNDEPGCTKLATECASQLYQ